MKKIRKTKNIEIEIQVQIEKNKKLLAFLKKNANFVGESRQVDKYYSPAHRNFVGIRPVSEWLRLRDSSGKYLITYKNWHRDKDTKGHVCDEYETEIEDFSQMENIFKVLDLKPVVTVDKIRKVWLYKNYEIAIDQVKNLGNFVEVEYKGKAVKKDSEAIAENMYAFLKTLGCGKMKRGNGGYAFMLFAPKEIVYEEH